MNLLQHVELLVSQQLADSSRADELRDFVDDWLIDNAIDREDATSLSDSDFDRIWNRLSDALVGRFPLEVR